MHSKSVAGVLQVGCRLRQDGSTKYRTLGFEVETSRGEKGVPSSRAEQDTRHRGLRRSGGLGTVQYDSSLALS